MSRHFDENALLIAKTLDSKKGEDIVLLDVSGATILADNFVICSGNSPIQVKTLADEVEKVMAQRGILKLRTEGYTEGRWIVVDFGDILVHVFHKEERRFYDIERLWKSGDNFMNYEGTPAPA